MSLELYPTRLFWENGRGTAKLHGKPVVLHAPPVLPGLPHLKVVMIDWAPPPHDCAEIIEQFGARREMNTDEIAAVWALLREVTA